MHFLFFQFFLALFNIQTFISPAEIEAGFILSVPHSQVASQAGMLEKEIYTQIGVPNSTVWP